MIGLLRAAACGLVMGIVLAAGAAAQGRAELPGGTPDVWIVTSAVPGARVELRFGPGIAFPAIGTLAPGERVRNRGCMPGMLEVWCQVESLSRAQIVGFVARRNLVEAGRPPSGGGGPEFWTVTGIAPGDRLNIRAAPSAQARLVGTLVPGETVRNLGCEGIGAARWCRIRSTVGADITGWVNGRFLREGAAPRPPAPPAPPVGGGDAGAGPDYWVVAGLPSGDRLNIRTSPTAQARIIGTLAPGETVRNLGCEGAGTARWCRIRVLTGSDIMGWVSGRYLREGAAPRPPAGGGDAGAGPDTWVVRGLPAGDRLNLRGAPTTQAPVLATLREGERVANLGCETVGTARWCRVRALGGVTVTGWVSGRYLREG
ncbi:MAG: SH3 domain-containing protein [Gemmobacter sp.]